jgi:uncharacterized metal-binding protein
MIGIIGRIRTESASATCVAGALAPDNLPGMATAAEGATVVFAIDGTALRTVTATVDDYLMNLAMAEEVCSLGGRPERYDASGRMT